jgi:hypothetical protein
MSSSTNLVDTAKVSNRRILRFESLDQVLAEAERLVEAERAGKLRKLGNWTLGQIFGHLAAWADFSYNGTPLKPPFFVRWILRLRKKKFLYGPMRPGVHIPRVEGGTLATAPMDTAEAHDRLRRVLERLKTEPPNAPNSIFGQMTHEEWIAINLRHAELHLGFLVPK